MTTAEWGPSTIIGIGLIVLAIYLLISKNLMFLIGMQVIYLKTNHKTVAIVSSVFLLLAGGLTVLLPFANQLSTTMLVIDLVAILLTTIGLFVYIYMQKDRS